MRIQRIFLLSFLALLFVGGAPIAMLSFYASRTTLEREISNSLENDAVMLMQQIDVLMFERLQNIHSWSHLDIVQEGRIGDVDKQLAQFLSVLDTSYPDVYRALFYLNADNKIVSASNPALIGNTFAPRADWIKAIVPYGDLVLENPELTPPYDDPSLLIRAPVPDKYGAGEQGQLYGVFNLRQIFQLFDQASNSESGKRYIVLLDADGRALAGSKRIRDAGLLLARTFADWKPAEAHGTMIHAGDPLTPTRVLVGHAGSQGYQGYANLGWSLLIIQSTEQAFHSIWSLWLWFGDLFLVTSLIAVIAAQWAAKRISNPILVLTRWVRNFQQHPAEMQPTASGVYEVAELSNAFAQLGDDLERSRQQVIRAAKLAVVGEMAAIMAHEVRTPLGILQTSAQILRSENALSADGRDMVRIINEETARLNRLISALLDCARPRPPQMQTRSLAKIIERAHDLLGKQADNKAIAIEWSNLAGEARLECDEEMLVQVFLNLVLNAIQILPHGGRIRVHLEDAGAQQLCITIEDSGPGIPEPICQRLFDPFFTTRETGIGLGLTVAQQIIGAHGGSIEIGCSRLGGACFIVLLPRHQTQPTC